MIKLSGVEWKRFYTDPEVWGTHKAKTAKYHEDEMITVDGVEAGDMDLEKIPDTSVVTVEGGEILDNWDMNYSADLCLVLKRWLKKQTCTVVLVEIPRSLMPNLLRFIKAIKGKVLG